MINCCALAWMLYTIGFVYVAAMQYQATKSLGVSLTFALFWPVSVPSGIVLALLK